MICNWPNVCDCASCAKVYNHEIADALRIRPLGGVFDASISRNRYYVSTRSALPTAEQLERVHLELVELIASSRPVRIVVGSAELRAMADAALDRELQESLKS